MCLTMIFDISTHLSLIFRLSLHIFWCTYLHFFVPFYFLFHFIFHYFHKRTAF